MQHLLDQPRGPIDAFETSLINAFSPIRNIQAIWVREVQTFTNPKKKYLRVVWLQLGRRSRTDQDAIQVLADELVVRVMNQPFQLEVRVIIDDLPPAEIAPSCIFRRGSGRV